MKRSRSQDRAVRAFIHLVLSVGVFVGSVGPGASTAEASEVFPHREHSTYKLRPAIDVPLLLAPTAIGFASLAAEELDPPGCATEENNFVCDPEAINGFDRGAVNNYGTGWQGVSDWAVPGAMVLSLASVFVAEKPGPFLVDAVVGVEAVMMSTAIGAILTTAVGRPRPWAYNEDVPLEHRLSGKNKLSFFSGHTATPAAATMYAFSTLYRRGVHPAYSFGTLALGTAVTSVVGAGRVLSGKHFATDVIAGAMIGGSMGVLIPALHDSNFTFVPEVSRNRAYVSASLQF
jgi:membrane-associated phospholipid phosphatase